MYDRHGNVYEWVADCYHESYEGAPSDGSAWIQDPKCIRAHMRGNDWGEPPIFSRSANRNDRLKTTRGDFLGFRVAREL
jgi:formylglycine-generating enzyme required for sulfatase activity